MNCKRNAEDAVLMTAAKATIGTEKVINHIVNSKGFNKAMNVSAKIMSHKACRMALVVPMAISAMTLTVFADEASGTANSILESIMKYLSAGVISLGALVAVLGGVQLGQAFKDENADGKVRGFNTLIGGAIIGAVGGIIKGIQITFDA